MVNFKQLKQGVTPQTTTNMALCHILPKPPTIPLLMRLSTVGLNRKRISISSSIWLKLTIGCCTFTNKFSIFKKQNCKVLYSEKNNESKLDQQLKI